MRFLIILVAFGVGSQCAHSLVVEHPPYPSEETISRLQPLDDQFQKELNVHESERTGILIHDKVGFMLCPLDQPSVQITVFQLLLSIRNVRLQSVMNRANSSTHSHKEYLSVKITCCKGRTTAD
jgi:hypothetical protein